MDIENIKRENAKNIARRMLWSGSVSFDLIAEAADLPPETVDQLAAEVYRERAALFYQLRGINTAADAPAALFDAVMLMNRLFYMREPGRGEQADLKNLFAEMDEDELSRMLVRLPDGGPGPGMAAEGVHFIDTLYADLMRRHYDDLQQHDDE